MVVDPDKGPRPTVTRSLKRPASGGSSHVELASAAGVARDHLRLRTLRLLERTRHRAVQPGVLQGPRKLIGQLANGGRIRQSKSDDSARQQISRTRNFLRDLFTLPGDPFHKFSDGYGIQFQVAASTARQQLRESAGDSPDDENAAPVSVGKFDPDELDRFSIHRQ